VPPHPQPSSTITHNPQLSAQSHMHGAFNFNRTPLTPQGTKVLIHKKPDTRGTWAPHAVEGWYLGPAMRHYRCYCVWAWNTNAERVANTLTWFPTSTIMPWHSSKDIVTAAAHKVTHTLLHPSPMSPPSPLTNSHHQQLFQLADVFQQHMHRPDCAPTELPAELPSLVWLPHPLPIPEPNDTPTNHPLAICDGGPFPITMGAHSNASPHCAS
jgi:hypothetical protein